MYSRHALQNKHDKVEVVRPISTSKVSRRLSRLFQEFEPFKAPGQEFEACDHLLIIHHASHSLLSLVGPKAPLIK